MRLVLLFALAAGAALANPFTRHVGTGRNGNSPGGGGGGAPTLPTTVAIYGDSIAAGVCSGSGPAVVLDGLLPAGWVFSADAGDGQPPAVAGLTAAQIRTRYTATRDTACGGERCGWYIIEGGVNSLRAGTTPQATYNDMVAIVDDALALGRGVVWLDVLPYNAAGETSADSRATSYNALKAAACATRPNARCLVLYDDFEAPAPADPGTMSDTYVCGGADRIHLKQAGTNELAARIRSVLP